MAALLAATATAIVEFAAQTFFPVVCSCSPWWERHQVRRAVTPASTARSLLAPACILPSPPLCRLPGSAGTSLPVPPSCIWPWLPCVAGLHYGAGAGGSSYGFGETVAEGGPMDYEQPGTASAQVPARSPWACGPCRALLGSQLSAGAGRCRPLPDKFQPISG